MLRSLKIPHRPKRVIKVRGLRLELETLTDSRAFFTFPKSAVFTYQFPQIIVSKLISKTFICFPVEIDGITAIFECEKERCCKISSQKSSNSVLPRCIFQFWKS